MKYRWIALYVENEVGVLAKVSGLFSGKSYNLQSLTVGETEDPAVSRMTISLIGDDVTFEQIKKQLNRSVGIIKVIDFTDTPIHMKEILFIKVKGCSHVEKEEVFRIAQVFGIQVTDYGKNSILLESTQTENRNNDVIHLLNQSFSGRLEVVRGGSVAVEAISIQER